MPARAMARPVFELKGDEVTGDFSKFGSEEFGKLYS
jgi:hypothetical protein